MNGGYWRGTAGSDFGEGFLPPAVVMAWAAPWRREVPVTESTQAETRLLMVTVVLQRVPDLASTSEKPNVEKGHMEQ